MTESNADGLHAGLDDSFDLFAELLDAEGLADAPPPSLTRRAPSDSAPMSFSQELIWLLDRATPGLTAYNLPIARRLRGPLDVAALERALGVLAVRHEALRTRLAEVDGEARQLIDPPSPVSVRVVDLRDAAPDTREREVERVVRERARAPFDLVHEHMFRATLVRIADDEHVLVLELHHIVVDGWSLGILFRELSAAYAAERAGRPAELPDVALQYGDYAVWQRTTMAGPRLEELLAFWRRQLGDATEPLSLPTDFPRSAVPTFAGARQSLTLSGELVTGMRSLAQSAHATLYMVLLAAYGTVLHRYAGKDDVLIGSGSAGRTMDGMEGLVGYVNNTLVQRVSFDGDPTFAELLQRVRVSALDAHDHQDVPLEKLVLELRQGDARLSDAPLFEVVLTMQDTMQPPITLEGLTVEPYGADAGATKFDITLLAAEREGTLRLTVQYRSDLFAPATMRRFLGHLQSVLEQGAREADARVSALTLLTAGERDALRAWNATQVDEGPAATLVQLFERQAARVPDRPALVAAAGDASPGAALTYAQLDARANQLAVHLRAMGVTVNSPVGLLIDRSPDAIVGLLGILKAGGAYVPLPPDAPPARIAQQIDGTGAAIVVTTGAHADAVPAHARVVLLDRDAAVLAGLPATNPPASATPGDLAYILHTSGSTGVPKGVAVTHANVVHYARAISRVLADMPLSEAGDGFAALDGWHVGLGSSLAADLGNTALFPALLSGATLHVFGESLATDASAYADYARANPLDLLKLTPSHLRALIGDGNTAEWRALLPRRWLVLGGEALGWELAEALVQSDACRVLNHYGPTESTVGACTFEVTRESIARARAQGARTVPIGVPLANTRTYVVNAAGNEQLIGIPGELLIGGAGVTRGYVGQPDQTALRFVANPVTHDPHDVVYRSGDDVRRLADGSLEFLGRSDGQVKIRGYRVEPGEVEQAIARHPSVGQCAVVPRPGNSDEVELVAFIIPMRDAAGPDDLPAWLGTVLPSHMIPSSIVPLDELPRTPSGKVDRRALAAHDVSVAAGPEFVAPVTETETRIAQIWAEVLKKERVGATEDFIALGGHSLLAIRVLGKLSRAFGVRLPLRTLFDAPTVGQLAGVVDFELKLAALEAMSDDEAARLLADGATEAGK